MYLTEFPRQDFFLLFPTLGLTEPEEKVDNDYSPTVHREIDSGPSEIMIPFIISPWKICTVI